MKIVKTNVYIVCIIVIIVITVITKGGFDMSEVERKITKIGNSLGVTIPAKILREAGLAYGDQVQVKTQKGKIILQKKEEIELPKGVDEEFLETLNKVLEEHDEAFKGLVDR